MEERGAARIEDKQILKRDTSLIKAALKGDSKAFATLMTLYKRRIERLGMSFFKNADDAEDFVQDVFLRAYTKLNTFKGDSQFSTWITRIAYNIAINAVNRRKEYLPIADEDLFTDPGFTPEERHIRAATMQAIRTAIRELPERFAICLDLYFFYGIPYQEISEITDFPVNTIKSHIFRAKRIIKEKLVRMEFN